MRLTNIEMYCSCSHVITNFSFRDPTSSSPYTIKGFYGIDADEIIASFDGVNLSSGSSRHSLSLRKRELVLRVVLNADYSRDQTPSDLRDHLYRRIATNRNGNVRLRFIDNDFIRAEINGFITKFESAHFNEAPEVQITIDCPDPLFRSPYEEVLVPQTEYQSDEDEYDGGSEPPPEIDPGLVIRDGVFEFRDDVSTAPHGCTMRFNFIDNASFFELRDHISAEENDWFLRVRPPVGSSSFLDGDQLVIVNEFRNRQIYIIRNEVEIHVADRVDPDPAWPVVFPGDNRFVVSHPQNYEVAELVHRHAFWGI